MGFICLNHAVPLAREGERVANHIVSSSLPRTRGYRGLPDIVWIGPGPRHWRLPAGALGWGLAHSPRQRMGQLTHIDWVPVPWADHTQWRPWCPVDGTRLFVRPSLVIIVATWDIVHATGRPGTSTVLRESMDLEMRLGCIW